jgi:hypothetical protein
MAAKSETSGPSDASDRRAVCQVGVHSLLLVPTLVSFRVKDGALDAEEHRHLVSDAALLATVASPTPSVGGPLEGLIPAMIPDNWMSVHRHKG